MEANRNMRREVEFQRALSRISTSCRQELDDLTLEVYTEALCYETSEVEWEDFTREAVRVGRFTWFPKVAELLDALREFRGLPNLDAEAVAAYERVLGAGVYTAEGGTSWSFRGVLEACGKAAAEAFLEAGGHNAFANTFRESERRERFVVAYRSVARIDQSARLLPPPQAKALLTGEVESRPFERGETNEIMERVAGIHSGEEAPRPVITKPPRVVEATEDRLALLRRQAQEIEAAAAPAAKEA